MHHAMFMLVHLPCCLLLGVASSSGNVAIVRIRSTMLVRLLHGLVLLPSGISGKMTVTLDLTTSFAMLVVRSIAMSRYLPLVYQASQIALITSNLFTLPSKALFGDVTASLNPSYSIATQQKNTLP